MDTIHNEQNRGANPQIEDGYLKIANEITEAFSRLRISGTEWKILWVILRKTYGWNKKMDCISTTQFQKETGIKRRNVSRTISDLVEKSIVIKNDDGFITSYGLQKDYMRWRPIIKNDDKKQTVIKNESKLSSKMMHTKDTNKRQSYKGRSKKETDPRVMEFFNFWKEFFQRETGQPYVFNYAKEGKLIKDLLRVHTFDALQETTRAFFRDEQCRHRGLTIGIFFMEMNRLVSQKAMDPLEQARRDLGRA